MLHNTLHAKNNSLEGDTEHLIVEWPSHIQLCVDLQTDYERSKQITNYSLNKWLQVLF